MSVVDVRLVDVVKRFGNVTAVDHISLEVRAGEFFSLLGPSGCGKTTTLRVIGGFEEPMSGLIELQGRDVTRVPPNRRNVNTVFQNYALFPHLTIFDNVAFGLRRKKIGEDEIKQRVASMLDLVELQGLVHRRRTRSPAARPSAWPSRAPSSIDRRCCSSTSRSGPWISSCGSRCRSS